MAALETYTYFQRGDIQMDNDQKLFCSISHSICEKLWEIGGITYNR